MKSREIVVGILVAIGVLLVGLIFLGLLFGFNGMGIPGTPMGVPGMMGGWAGFGWLLLCLGPLLLGALLIGGIVWLLSNRDSIQRSVPAVLDACPSCGQPVQRNWNNCPNCGHSLMKG
jgi:hypothetical protein